jgi:hypothetical protein
MRRLAFIFAMISSASLLVTNMAQAQDEKVRVSVAHSGDDSIGVQFAYAVREAVRASNGFKLVSRGESGMDIGLVTVDPERSASSTGLWTAVAVTITMTNFLPYEKGNPQTWYPIYLTSQVLTVGRQRVDDQARAVMAALDSSLDQYRRDAKGSK